MDNCGGQSYDGAGNMAGRYVLDKFLLVETSHTNCWIHPCEGHVDTQHEAKLQRFTRCEDMSAKTLPLTLTSNFE